jgi:hypothetical protein
MSAQDLKGDQPGLLVVCCTFRLWHYQRKAVRNVEVLRQRPRAHHDTNIAFTYGVPIKEMPKRRISVKVRALGLKLYQRGR